MLSVIIPARCEKYLEQTIRNVLENAQGEIEIIAELDGYIPEPQIVINDPRVIFIHHKESIGQRACINHAASIAKGKYIMKLDAHCAVGPGFDVILAETCQPEWTVIPRMYNLDIETWLPKKHKVTDYMYISGPENGDKAFRAMYYEGEEYRKWHSRSEMIDDTMACMGPGWFMEKERFLSQGGCDEGHEGGWGQQSVEVSLKAWLSGGSLKVNKNTWFAHWFRGGSSGPGFPYPISGNQVERVRKYSKDLWLNDKWPLATRKLNWVIDKFNPPTWKTNKCKNSELQELFYKEIHLKKYNIAWRGVRMIKMPSDVALYHMAIWNNKPDFIVEIGTAQCGSALMFADFCEIVGNGKVISIDIKPRGPLIPHPRITYLQGDSKSDEIVNKVKEIVGSGSVMVIIDGDHRRTQVKWELIKYKDIVTSGQYLVVEDCYGRKGELVGPGQARDWFLKWNKRYTLTDFDRPYMVGMTKEGWLKKR